jgi:hypothetical protein
VWEHKRIELEKRDIVKNIIENHLLFYEKKQVIFLWISYFSDKLFIVRPSSR